MQFTRVAYYTLVGGFCLTLIPGPQQSIAANVQGGGAFTTPKKKNKNKRVRKAKRKAVSTPRVRVNYDGSYSLSMKVLSKPINSSCHSGRRKIAILNGKTSGEMFPLLGAVVGGRVNGGTLQIYKIRNGLLDRADYSGSIRIPASPGKTGAGKVKDVWSGGTCIWQATLTRH